ncbi:MAG: hypothetical protein ACTHYD_09100 [Canibacter sp.]
MTTWRKKLAAIFTGVMVTGALALTGTGTAQALTPNYNVGPFTTKSQCETAKRAYISSWTKISQGCTYYPKQGGFTAKGYYFHYRAIA